MDPQLCLDLILDAFKRAEPDGECSRADREILIENIDNLREWIANGGFLPYDPRSDPPFDF